jgi:hypothetical protein
MYFAGIIITCKLKSTATTAKLCRPTIRFCHNLLVRQHTADIVGMSRNTELKRWSPTLRCLQTMRVSLSAVVDVKFLVHCIPLLYHLFWWPLCTLTNVWTPTHGKME